MQDLYLQKDTDQTYDNSLILILLRTVFYVPDKLLFFMFVLLYITWVHMQRAPKNKLQTVLLY